MKYIKYAIQGKDGKWTGFLQKLWEKGEHGDEGSVRWLDPTKRTFDTEADAIAGAQKLADDNGIKEVFEAPADTDFRMGVIEIASKEAIGTEEEKVNAIATAESTERQRIETAKARQG